MPTESGEPLNFDAAAREAINETLKDVLCDDGWGRSHWDNLIRGLRDEFQIETDMLELAQHAPSLFTLFQLGALRRKGIIKPRTVEALSEIIHSLLRIAFDADKGDADAVNQLRAIHKTAHPKVYRLPPRVIKRLADSYHTSPHLARAWSVRWLMYELSMVVKPERSGASLLDGPVELTTVPRLMKSRYYEKAARHIKKGSTLQSLATAAYLEELESEGIDIDEEEIHRDFRKLKKWEDANLDEKMRRWLPLTCIHRGERYPTAHLPVIPMYSDGWKRLWRRGKKQKS